MAHGDAPRRVWYAAYGSNLHWPRFRCYLQGGRAPGGSRVHAPCADRRPPRAQAAATLPFPLFFAGRSPTWGGGNAFVDPTRRDARTLARLYLVTAEQFAGIAAGEAHRKRVRLPPARAATSSWYRFAPGAYGVVVRCGQRGGLPIVTVTGPPVDARVAWPRPRYLTTIVAGLTETHRLSASAAADYLAGVPGVWGHYARRDLVALVSGESPAAT
ncbi:MAG TPA: hypothetical protein VM287_04835 [Egibacteraceae bacterium]|nr:hypothetical protein [Egibacteraceae bacterium]